MRGFWEGFLEQMEKSAAPMPMPAPLPQVGRKPLIGQKASLIPGNYGNVPRLGPTPIAHAKRPPRMMQAPGGLPHASTMPSYFGGDIGQAQTMPHYFGQDEGQFANYATQGFGQGQADQIAYPHTPVFDDSQDELGLGRNNVKINPFSGFQTADNNQSWEGRYGLNMPANISPAEYPTVQPLQQGPAPGQGSAASQAEPLTGSEGSLGTVTAGPGVPTGGESVDQNWPLNQQPVPQAQIPGPSGPSVAARGPYTANDIHEEYAKNPKAQRTPQLNAMRDQFVKNYDQQYGGKGQLAYNTAREDPEAFRKWQATQQEMNPRTGKLDVARTPNGIALSTLNQETTDPSPTPAPAPASDPFEKTRGMMNPRNIALERAAGGERGDLERSNARLDSALSRYGR